MEQRFRLAELTPAAARALPILYAACSTCAHGEAKAGRGREREKNKQRGKANEGRANQRAWCASTLGPTSKTRVMASDDYSRAAPYQAPLPCWHPWRAPSGLMIHSGASCQPSACVREGGWPGCRFRASSCQAACRRPSAATATLPARHSDRAGGSGGVGAAQPQRPGTPWLLCWTLASASAARHLLTRVPSQDRELTVRPLGCERKGCLQRDEGRGGGGWARDQGNGGAREGSCRRGGYWLHAEAPMMASDLGGDRKQTSSGGNYVVTFSWGHNADSRTRWHAVRNSQKVLQVLPVHARAEVDPRGVEHQAPTPRRGDCSTRGAGSC